MNLPERWRDVATVGVIVAVLLLVAVGLRAMRREPPGEDQGRVAPGVQTGLPAEAGTVPVGSTSPATSVVGNPDQPSSAGPQGVGTVPAAAPGPAATAAAPWVKRPAAEFTVADLAQCGQGVQLGLGTYAVQSGDEFDVTLRVTAPALESFTLVVRYDAARLAMVPGSAKPVGGQFRGGIECYAQKSGGRLVLIHAGTPGRKNFDAGAGTTAVTWRMRALQAGATELKADPETSFTNGRGDSEAYDVSGGDVTIR